MEPKRFITCIVIWFLLSTPLLLNAGTEAGVEFTDTITSEDNTLILNSTGTRSFWFIPIYAAALYLPEKHTSAERIIQANVHKQMVMHFIYRKVSKSKLLKTLDQGFSENLSRDQLALIEPEINQLKDLFKTVYKGDRIILDYSPTIGTRLFLNNELQGTIPGENFHEATFRIWLGDKPADTVLKNQLLNQTD